MATNRPTKLGTKVGASSNPKKPNFQKMDTKPRPARRASKSSTPFLITALQLFLNLGIILTGLSVITGTSIASFFRPTDVPIPIASAPIPELPPVPVEIPKVELASLTTKINALTATEPNIKMAVFLVNVDNGSYVNIQGAKAIAAASMIKIPILVAFLQDVDAGKAKLDEQLVISKDVIVGEAGGLQYQPIGTKISALETLTLMIVISDNTATNMILKRLGGIEVANQRFSSWDLTSTVIRNPLPDLTGTNTTSPQDLVNLLSMVEQGKLLSPRSRDRLMDIMRRTKTNTLLPQGIPADALIAHKTGDIQSVVGDAGIIDMPSGKRYIISAIAKRPSNDQRANELIRKISRTVYGEMASNIKN